MPLVHRVLATHPFLSLEQYVAARGGRGLDAARGMAPDEITASIAASGLRGLGGAGFPTARKWQTVLENRSMATLTSTWLGAPHNGT